MLRSARSKLGRLWKRMNRRSYGWIKLCRDERAFAGDFIVLMATIFIIMVVYIALDTAFQELYNIAYNSSLVPLDILDMLNTAWLKIPLAVIFGMFIKAVVSGLRREPYTYR